MSKKRKRKARDKWEFRMALIRTLGVATMVTLTALHYIWGIF